MNQHRSSLRFLLFVFGLALCLLAACSRSKRPTEAPAPVSAEIAAASTQAASMATQAAAAATLAAAEITRSVTPLRPTSTLAPTTPATPAPIAIVTSSFTPISSEANARVTTAQLNVRAGPGEVFGRIGQVRQGDVLVVLGRNEGGDWIQVQAPGGLEGWVAARLTDLGAADSSIPLASNIPPTPKVVARKGLIAFKSSRGGIWIMNPDGSNQQRLPNESLYYNALRAGGSEYCARNGLYCVIADSRNSRSVDIWVEDREYHSGWSKIVSNDHTDWDPRIHPDGWWVVFVTNRNGNDELWLINRQAQDERRLTVNGWEWDKHPSWSPDGSRIVFFSNRITGRRQLWLLDPWSPLGQNNPRNISINSYEDYDPVWLK